MNLKNKFSYLTKEELSLAEHVDTAGCNWPDRLWLMNKMEVLLHTINGLRAEIATDGQHKCKNKEERQPGWRS